VTPQDIVKWYKKSQAFENMSLLYLNIVKNSKNQILNNCIIEDGKGGEYAWLITRYICIYILLRERIFRL